MAHLTDGTTVDEDEWNGQDDRISNLEAAVITIGGSEGDATLDSNIGWQEKTADLSATGSVTVTHGLGWTPAVVLVQLRGNPSNSGPYICYVSTITSSSFIVFFGQWTSTGSWSPGASGQSVTFDWLAMKDLS